jgi:O-antigen ligase
MTAVSRISWPTLLLQPLFVASGFLVAAGGSKYLLVVALAASVLVVAFTRPVQFAMAVIPALVLVPALVRLPSGGLPDMTPQRVLLLVAFAAVVVAVPRSGDLLPNPLRYALALFAMYVLAAVIVRGHNHQGINKAFGYAAEPLLPLLLVPWIVRDRARVVQLVDRLIAAMGVASLLALYEEVRGRFLFHARAPYFFHAPLRNGHIRVQGVFPHPLVLGVAIALVAPIAYMRWRSTTGGRSGLILLALALMMGAAYFTYNRGPLIAVAAALMLLAILSSHRRIEILAGLTLALMVASIAAPVRNSYGELFSGLTGNVSKGSSSIDVVYRQQLFAASTGYIDSHPFGAGPGQSQNLALYGNLGGYDTDLAGSIDNAYLKWALEVGWVGLALFFLIVAALWSTTVRVWRLHAADGELGPIAAGLVASLFAMIVVSADVATFTWAQILLIFWTLMGLVLALTRLATQPSG